MKPELTTGQVAKELGIHPDSLRYHVRKGTVRPSGHTLGGQARFSREDLESLRSRLVSESESRVGWQLAQELHVAETMEDPDLRALFTGKLTEAMVDPSSAMAGAIAAFEILSQKSLLELREEEESAPA